MLLCLRISSIDTRRGKYDINRTNTQYLQEVGSDKSRASLSKNAVYLLKSAIPVTTFVSLLKPEKLSP